MRNQAGLDTPEHLLKRTSPLGWAHFVHRPIHTAQDERQNRSGRHFAPYRSRPHRGFLVRFFNRSIRPEISIQLGNIAVVDIIVANYIEPCPFRFAHLGWVLKV